MTAAHDGLPPLRDVIRKHDLIARKSLGQNFLLDLNLTGRIARAAGPLKGATIIEVGPGPGGLTRALLSEGASRVIAIERDRRAIAALQEVADHYPGRLTVIEGDALEFEPAAYLDDGPVRIVANLPYNIATPLLVGWLETEPWPPFFRPSGADVSARGGRTHCRQPRHQGLWTIVDPHPMAHAAENPVRHRPIRFRAAAKGHVIGGGVRAAPVARSLRSAHPRTGGGSCFRTTAQDAASEPEVADARSLAIA